MRRQQTAPPALRSPGDNSDSSSETERRILTIEEREAAYQRARARIFKDLEGKDEDEKEKEQERELEQEDIEKEIKREQDKSKEREEDNHMSEGGIEETKSGSPNTMIEEMTLCGSPSWIGSEPAGSDPAIGTSARRARSPRGWRDAVCFPPPPTSARS